METPEGLDQHFRFLVLALETQARGTQIFLLDPVRKGMPKLHSRKRYIDNLKTVVDNECFGLIHSRASLSRSLVNRVRAAQRICDSLARIGDILVSVAEQAADHSCREFQAAMDVEGTFSPITAGLAPIQRALAKGKMDAALSICRVGSELDRACANGAEKLMAALQEGGDPGHLVSVLCVLRDLGRVGCELLNIGEAILFSILGEHIDIEQFHALKKTLSKSGRADSVESIDYRAIKGTRSGCRVGEVRGAGTRHEAGSRIYKEGPLEKIRREKENNSRWQQYCPGLVPEVYSFHAQGKNGSLLLEFLPGETLDAVIRSAEEAVVKSALDTLERTLFAVWDRTAVTAPRATDYIHQIQARLADVLAVHPAFFRESTSVGRAAAHSVRELLTGCAAIEKELAAPVSVFIHGDFNTSNVVYNNATGRVHFIDLHRSRDFDYVQDASVFLVSLFRTPVFDADCRRRINGAIGRFHKGVEAFSIQRGDASFAVRLALALARSFYTSTRFELNTDFARAMYNRALFLLEKVQGFQGGDWAAFRFPEEVLYY
ncbi:phosphotransferase [Desulfoluna butyratoxydans]|uniref:Aminoglycoside phosphotransferase n=1 Tax=Desulfoluna butyratoxydans TaxID=231438 RepID=A0A4V6IKW4_9BACT|nr:phosphotransferase [Desulfoluna butyratoxydans]VFQ42738.1 aminoglycoside phosphotransferase [Desulfoluna butyratoxydans]